MQKDIFVNGEGDNWFDRNKHKRDKRFARYKKHVVEKINVVRGESQYKILEIGCSYGWGVNMIDTMCDSCGYGIDPSLKAIEYGKSLYNNINLTCGTADHLPFSDKIFDVVVLAFCLYICDPEDLFKIAYEIDRVLKNGGFVFLVEFDSSGVPYYNDYKHKAGVKCRKMNFCDMFLWHPSYNLLYKDVFDNGYVLEVDEREAIFMLRKDPNCGFVKNPF